MNFFIASAFAQDAAGAAAPGGNPMIQYVFLAGFVAVFYFLVIRPQSKRAKEHNKLLGALQKGDEVVTTGGIVGKVVKVSEGFVIVSVSDTVELRFQKASIVALLPKGTIKAIGE